VPETTAPRQLPEASTESEPTDAVVFPCSKLVSFWQAMKITEVMISKDEILVKVFMR
jgi:hypothetical protein